MSLRTLDISWLMITATWKTLSEGRKLSKLKGCNIWLRLRSILDSLTPWPGRSGGCPVNSVPGSTSTRSQKRYEEINENIYIYIHFFHKLQFLWFCFLIFSSPSDAIYSSLLSLPFVVGRMSTLKTCESWGPSSRATTVPAGAPRSASNWYWRGSPKMQGRI